MSSMDERQAICEILETCKRPHILDLGSHRGEDTIWMVDACRKKNPVAVMVEADKQNYDAIVAAQIPFATAVHAAISDHTGWCDFWACYTPEGRGSGSIRRPTGHKITHPWFDFRELAGGVPCYTLDDLLFNHLSMGREWMDHVDVLWADLQGAERDMIAGGQETLKRTRYLFVEAEEQELYEGQAIRPDLLAMLPGWTVTHTFDFNLLLKNDRYDRTCSTCGMVFK